MTDEVIDGAEGDGAEGQRDEELRLEELVSYLERDIDDAVSYITSDIGPYRRLATDFYHARPFGDEEDGRSQIVMPVVRDTVRATMPSLMRIFFGSYSPILVSPSSEAAAKQAPLVQAAVRDVLNHEQQGFTTFHSVFKDALVRKVGFATAYWDDSVEIKARTLMNVSEEQLVDLVEEFGDDAQVLEAKLLSGPGEPEVFSYSVRVVERAKRGRVKVEAIPPEELIIDRCARSIHTARLVGHWTLRSKGWLVANGVSPELLEDIGVHDTELALNEEAIARQPSASPTLTGMSMASPSSELVRHGVWYYRYDFDGDGIDELRRIVTVGDDYRVVHNDYADCVPIFGACPDPEPHVVFGLSQADVVADLQVVESHMWRDILDSSKASIFPRMGFVEGQVNIDDVLNTEIGAAIRMRQPGMVQPIEVPFTGAQMLPLLDTLSDVKERRTGVRNSSPALDAKALQSTNQMAVNAAITGAQAQVEMIARIFAETFVVPLYRHILKLLRDHQQWPTPVQAGGQVQDVVPAELDPYTDFTVDPGLGHGSSDQKIAALNATGARQVAVLSQFGVDNPLCSLQHLYNTEVRLLQLSGIEDTGSFWRDPSTYQAPPPPPPQPTPEQVLAEAEMRNTAAKLDLDRLKTILEDDRERDKLDADIVLKAAELQARYGAAVDVAAIRAQVDKERAEAQASARAQQGAMNGPTR